MRNNPIGTLVICLDVSTSCKLFSFKDDGKTKHMEDPTVSSKPNQKKAVMVLLLEGKTMKVVAVLLFEEKTNWMNVILNCLFLFRIPLTKGRNPGNNLHLHRAALAALLFSTIYLFISFANNPSARSPLFILPSFGYPQSSSPTGSAGHARARSCSGLPLAPPLLSSTAAAVEPVLSASMSNAVARSATGSGSSRRNPTQVPRAGEDNREPPPFVWTTDRRATVHSVPYLQSVGIRSISGEVKCKRCDSQYTLEYDLETKFSEIAEYIMVRMSTMHDRGPNEWMNPRLPSCPKCRLHEASLLVEEEILF